MLDELRALGADVDVMLQLFGGDEETYVSILISFLDDLEKYDVEKQIEIGDYNQACLNSHALKGASGNLGLTPVYKMFTEVNNLFKQGENEKAIEVYHAGVGVLNQMVECIKKKM